MSLLGKTAIVTGAGSGIGQAISLALCHNGVNVGACSRSISGLDELSVKTDGMKGEVYCATVDVRNGNALQSFVKSVHERFGSIDILIANAGIGIFKSIQEMTEEDFTEVMSVNMMGVFHSVKAVLSFMLEKKAGDVILISSLAGKHGIAGGAAYCASKYALRGFAESLLHDLRHDGIRTITLYPGSVDTSFSSRKKSHTSSKHEILYPEDVADAVIAALTAPRRATISEIDIRPSIPR